MSIPVAFEDAEAWLLDIGAFHGVPVKNLKPKDLEPPCSVIVLRVDPQNKITPLSRYVRIAASVHVVTAAGEADMPTARQLALDYGAFLEHLMNTPLLSGPFLDGQVDSGPVRAVDPDTGLHFAYLTFVAEQHAA